MIPHVPGWGQWRESDIIQSKRSFGKRTNVEFKVPEKQSWASEAVSLVSADHEALRGFCHWAGRQGHRVGESPQSQGLIQVFEWQELTHLGRGGAH